jgi:ABC-type glutathione transport system ATPase component
MADELTNAQNADHPILAGRNLTLHYAPRRSFGAARATITALQDVSLEIFAGKTLALAGPSGSGKSSLARCLLHLEQPSAGQILYKDKSLFTLNREELKQARREIHLIFQDSASALNPSLTLEEILGEPFVIHKTNAALGNPRKRIREVMEQVELPLNWIGRRPMELSGGQRQRVAIARSLLLHPKVLVLDEALSALDLSTQGQIANLLLSLQARHLLGYLYITHDLSMASLLADTVAVMKAGRVVQRGAPSDVFTENLHSRSDLLIPNTLPRETKHVTFVSSDK